ncbi:cytochrome b [Bordetella pseudohinzii]|uniref:Cytochrome B n=1 Tax=Bordetella pseudohinzii TaxID=1331258 RepID=A0A0J6BZP0_9BORD|nr:cytochrome b [Bordetella pseudohinzii]ANY15575.1 cytochrome B [Bordetella pseudohinzii]KMM27104.1 cytochrome B561 [Bordetella pseudohinzii]KXA82295.1 cytochrome B [Bordetella pseudohinzii]KXA82701.1 cytochrome B [Bordetella pseudohinzii]CUI56892.1 Cytochrome b561 homolog 1 [Bordetella pseudohinzii]
MSESIAVQRYTRGAVALHWITAVLVALAYLAIEIRGPKGDPGRPFWTGIHEWAGALVLLVALVRVGWRARHEPPADLNESVLLSILARLAHLALYIFILAQPLLGMLTLNLADRPVTLIGLDWSFRIAGPNPEWRPLVKEAHELIGNLFYFVIGLHALAALWHHYVKRDDTLRRML